MESLESARQPMLNSKRNKRECLAVNGSSELPRKNHKNIATTTTGAATPVLILRLEPIFLMTPIGYYNAGSFS